MLMAWDLGEEARRDLRGFAIKRGHPGECSDEYLLELGPCEVGTIASRSPDNTVLKGSVFFSLGLALASSGTLSVVRSITIETKGLLCDTRI